MLKCQRCAHCVFPFQLIEVYFLVAKCGLIFIYFCQINSRSYAPVTAAISQLKSPNSFLQTSPNTTTAKQRYLRSLLGTSGAFQKPRLFSLFSLLALDSHIHQAFEKANFSFHFRKLPSSFHQANRTHLRRVIGTHRGGPCSLNPFRKSYFSKRRIRRPIGGGPNYSWINFLKLKLQAYCRFWCVGRPSSAPSIPKAERP